MFHVDMYCSIEFFTFDINILTFVSSPKKACKTLSCLFKIVLVQLNIKIGLTPILIVLVLFPLK